MSTTWRISSFNGLLLAAYFIPTWTLAAFRIMTSPIHGLYERPNIAVALFVSDHLQLSGMETVRAAWLLALGRLTVVAFFAIFLLFVSRRASRRDGGCGEALAMALGIGSAISFAIMIVAAQAGELAAVKLHATELLMLLGTAIVFLLEPSVESLPAKNGLALEQPKPVNHR